MSAYSSSLKKPLIRNNSAVRSEYNDSLLRDSDRADNRLQEQYKELERARKVIEADLKKQKKAMLASHTPTRRSSCPSIHSRLQARLHAEKQSADERLNKFLAQNHKNGDSHSEQTTSRHTTTNNERRRRAQTDPHLLQTGYESTPRNIRSDKSPSVRKKRSDSKTKDHNDNEVENDEGVKTTRRRTREEFYSQMSKPKHPVQDKKAIRAKIEQDMDKTRKTERRMSRPNNDYLQGVY